MVERALSDVTVVVCCCQTATVTTCVFIEQSTGLQILSGSIRKPHLRSSMDHVSMIQCLIDEVQWRPCIICQWSSSARHHVVWRPMFGIWSKIDITCASMSRRSNLNSKHITTHRGLLQQLQISLMSLILLPYNMDSATLTIDTKSKWRHYHFVYTSIDVYGIFHIHTSNTPREYNTVLVLG